MHTDTFRITEGKAEVSVSELNRLNDLAKDLKDQEVALKNKEAKLETEYKKRETRVKETEEKLKEAIKGNACIIASSMYLVDHHGGHAFPTISEIKKRVVGTLPNSLDFEVMDDKLQEGMELLVEDKVRKSLAVDLRQKNIFQLLKWLKQN